MEFCHILNKFAAQLDECLSFKDFCLKQNFRASSRRKLGESAICSKCEQNSTAAFSVAYLFFIIYQKSKVWTITRLENLSGVYVECYRFLIFVVTDSVYYKYQYSKTYTLCCGLNHVNYLNIIKRDHVSATVRTRLHLASGWSNDHSGA